MQETRQNPNRFISKHKNIHNLFIAYLLFSIVVSLQSNVGGRMNETLFVTNVIDYSLTHVICRIMRNWQNINFAKLWCNFA